MPSQPVLLIHGLQAGPTTWWRVAADLGSLGFAISTPTLLGHAGRPATADSLEALAADVPLEAPAVVIGHSLGALVALELAARRPELVLGLVLEDPPARSGLDPQLLAQEVKREAAEARAVPATLLERLLGENPTWARQDAEHVVANRAALDDAVATAPLERSRWDLVAMAAAVSCPITLLAASPDRSALTEPERSGLIAAADHVLVIESGHGIHRDRPGVWVAAVARAAARAFPIRDR